MSAPSEEQMAATVRGIIAPISTRRHAMDCTMRRAIYDGARCSCDLTDTVSEDVKRRVLAALRVARAKLATR